MIEIFIWVVFSLLGIQLLILALLIGWKMKNLAAENEIRKTMETLKPDFRKYIEGTKRVEPTLPTAKKNHFRFMETMLDEFLGENFQEEQKARIHLLADKHLAEYYRRALKKGQWAERINALYFIEDFRLFSLKEDVYQHFMKISKRDEEFRQCIRVCATLQEVRLMNAAIESGELSFGMIKELLYRLDENLLKTTLDRMQLKEDISENMLHAFITFSGEHQIDMLFPFVEKKLRDERKEVRLKAMSSLCDYKKMANPAILPEFFDSEYWQERMYAAKLTGACHFEQYKQNLVDLLSDNVWWVRFAGAENIKVFKGGNTMLEQVVTDHTDAYARDIAKHMLTRGGGNLT
ncbi:HEAT domain-containing protein [Planococcus antarcticus DSM 14505]|uniref:HEAT domain-containing protein n=1 Tax=Planococcus antarcticus DSM 14505 TaxID=1185653 RepID=A0A1C7DDY1_9BACL|nr:hypothetical protein [Planococcus antarcticus]ANU09453.1 hypothetical protein BBH88_03565 [Planococcus antarcticus DSM 14505]EIM06085.1 HEAT domain-containing protein [Planococcus antarcticus DSM 14505]